MCVRNGFLDKWSSLICRFSGRQTVSYVLDAQKLSLVRPARAVFPRRDSSGRMVESPTLTSSLQMYEQWQARNVCNNHLVYVSVSSCSFVCIMRCSVVLVISSLY